MEEDGENREKDGVQGPHLFTRTILYKGAHRGFGRLSQLVNLPHKWCSKPPEFPVEMREKAPGNMK